MKTLTEMLGEDAHPDMDGVFAQADTTRSHIVRWLKLLPDYPPQGYGQHITAASGLTYRLWTIPALCRFLAIKLGAPWEVVDGINLHTGSKHSWLRLYRRDMSVDVDINPFPNLVIGACPVVMKAEGSHLVANNDPSNPCFSVEEQEEFIAEAALAESFTRK